MPSEHQGVHGAAPCRGWSHAARWNGPPYPSATGTAQPEQQPLPAGEAHRGISDSVSDRSASGTKHTSATTSRRHR